MNHPSRTEIVDELKHVYSDPYVWLIILFTLVISFETGNIHAMVIQCVLVGPYLFMEKHID